MYRVMAYSAPSHDVYFPNRDEDQYNDNTFNPVIVKHDQLDVKVQAARDDYHQKLIDRFDSDMPLEVKQFLFIASLLDPRTKKLTFDGDDLMKHAARKLAERWFKVEYDANYKGKVPKSPTSTSGGGGGGGGSNSGGDGATAHTKRRNQGVIGGPLC